MSSPASAIPVAQAAPAKHLVATSITSGTITGDVTRLHPGWTRLTWGSSTSPAATNTSAAAAWSCSLYVGPVTLPNGVNGNLQAETDQVCSGAFGKQQTRADFARSRGERLPSVRIDGVLRADDQHVPDDDLHRRLRGRWARNV